MSEPDSLWFVIYCEMDDSHSLIPEDAVIYDEDNVQVHDDVRFSYPGCKDLLDGCIKGMSSKFRCIVYEVFLSGSFMSFKL